ncbi:frizzled-6-like [Branchiostoma floridae x Branchiostoma belcheri]
MPGTGRAAFLWIIGVVTLVESGLGGKCPSRESPPRVGECVPIRDDRCISVLPYSQTTFPTPLGLPDQDLALAVTPGVFTALDLVSRCPHLDTFLCTLIYPQCTNEKIR